jgi:hypothetical protein
MGLGVGYRSGREAKIEIPAGCSEERRKIADGKVSGHASTGAAILSDQGSPTSNVKL